MSTVSKKEYEELSKERLSTHFILRDFLFSTEAAVDGKSNFPSDNKEQVIESGKQLCKRVLEPILEKYGRFAITFGYQARETMEASWPREDPDRGTNSSQPHQWDRGTYGNDIFARVDILPFCITDGTVTKYDFGLWCMMNLDVDLLQQWRHSDVNCITISPYPRRVWLEWVRHGEGAKPRSNKIEHWGRDYWSNKYPQLSPEQRPKFHPSATKGGMNLLNTVINNLVP